MALKMYFWDPHNEIKCVLSIIESYSIEEKTFFLIGPNWTFLGWQYIQSYYKLKTHLKCLI